MSTWEMTIPLGPIDFANLVCAPIQIRIIDFFQT